MITNRHFLRKTVAEASESGRGCTASKTEVPGMDNGVGSNLSNQFIYDSDLTVGFTDEQEPHPMILGSLKIAIYPGQQLYANLVFF
jgi:hypothetical protein